MNLHCQDSCSLPEKKKKDPLLFADIFFSRALKRTRIRITAEIFLSRLIFLIKQHSIGSIPKPLKTSAVKSDSKMLKYRYYCIACANSTDSLLKICIEDASSRLNFV